MNELMTKFKEEVKNFVACGGDEAKFWSGKMSIVAGRIIECDTISLSNSIQLLKLIKEEYDRVIMERTDRNWEEAMGRGDIHLKLKNIDQIVDSVDSYEFDIYALKQAVDRIAKQKADEQYADYWKREDMDASLAKLKRTIKKSEKLLGD